MERDRAKELAKVVVFDNGIEVIPGSVPGLNPDELVTVAEAAKMLGVTPSTIKGWVARGSFKIIGKTQGGHSRIPLCEIERIKEVRKGFKEFTGKL